MVTASALDRAPLRQRIYAIVRERIVLGELLPGSRVRDGELAESLGASRTPAREALIQLASDGLLESLVGRGFRVPPLRRTEVEQLHPLITTLEPLALSTSVPVVDEQLAELEAICAELESDSVDERARNELDVRWHRCLIRGCANPRLMRYVEEVRDLLRRYELAYLREHQGMRQSVAEHRTIAARAGTGDLAGAAQLLSEHWRRGRDELLAIVPEEELS